MLPQSIAVANTENIVSFKAQLIAGIKKEELKLYVSYCPALDLYSQGETEKEAKKNIVEAVELFIQTAYEEGTLKNVLADCGFSLATGASPKRKKRKLNYCGKTVKILTEIPLAFA